VNRARARLETLRLLDRAARGALLGGAAGLVLLLADKLAPGLPFGPAVPWILLGAGTAAGGLEGLLRTRSRVTRESAALLLDGRLGTQERIVTVACAAPSPFTERVAAELAAATKVPRMRLPRSAALAPAALFVLFAAGLLPERTEDGRAGATVHVAGTSSAAGAGEPLPDVSAAVARLERGAAPTAAEEAGLREAIARGLHRPEERGAARRALDHATEGDGAAARRVARALRARLGGRGGLPVEEIGAPEPGAAGADGGLLRAVAYPEARELITAYRRALAELEEKDQ
jgi:hypothetical protein